MAAPPGVTPMARELDPAALIAEQDSARTGGRALQSASPLGYVPIAGRVAYRLDPEWITLGDGGGALGRDPEDLRQFDGRTAYMQATRASRSTSPASTGRKPTASSPASSRRSARRPPPCRSAATASSRRDARRLQRSADRGRLQRRPMRAFGRRLGPGSADVVIEDSYVNVSRSSLISRRFGDQRHRTVLARVSAPRQRRRDQCEGRAEAPADGGPPRRVRAARLAGGRVGLGRVPPDRELRNAVRRAGRCSWKTASPTARPSNAATGALNSKGPACGRRSSRSRRAPGAMTGAAWIGWDGNYSFTADGERIPVESLKTAGVPDRAASGVLALQGRRRRDVRGAALRRQPSASSTCSPATKASARSPGTSPCAASC